MESLSLADCSGRRGWWSPLQSRRTIDKGPPYPGSMFSYFIEKFITMLFTAPWDSVFQSSPGGALDGPRFCSLRTPRELGERRTWAVWPSPRKHCHGERYTSQIQRVFVIGCYHGFKVRYKLIRSRSFMVNLFE